VIDKIINLVKQMNEDDKKHLFQRIQREYALEEKTGMLRDDIVEKVLALLHTEFTHLDVTVNEHDELESTMDLDAVDITSFADTLLKEFDLEEIAFAKVMEWQTVKDMVDFIEDALESKGE